MFYVPVLLGIDGTLSLPQGVMTNEDNQLSPRDSRTWVLLEYFDKVTLSLRDSRIIYFNVQAYIASKIMLETNKLELTSYRSRFTLTHPYI